MGCKAQVILGEAQTLYTPAGISIRVRIFGVKNNIPIAALPGNLTAELVAKLHKILQFVPGDNVLKTSLNNIGAIFHPALTVLGPDRVDPG